MSITYHLENRFLDKRTWGAGPWQTEPDKVFWTDEPTGLPCLAVRHATSGHWCGYVGVGEGHQAFGLPYDQASALAEPDEDGYRGLAVHGGLTYAEFCQEGSNAEAEGICHVPQPGQPERVYWLGFDCSHAMDYNPAYGSLSKFGYGIPSRYRTLAYVQGECAKLAAQLRALA